MGFHLFFISKETKTYTPGNTLLPLFVHSRFRVQSLRSWELSCGFQAPEFFGVWLGVLWLWGFGFHALGICSTGFRV